MPKVLIVVTKGELGGAQRFVIDLANGLKDRHWDVSVGIGDGSFIPEETAKSGIPCISFKHLKRSPNPFKGILFALELRREIRKRSIDIVHLNSSNALIGSILAGVPVVFTFHGLSVLDPAYKASALKRFLFELYFKLFTKFIDLGVFVSKKNMELGSSMGLAKRSVQIYNGAPQSELLMKEEARELLLGTSEPNHSFIFGSIGRLAYPKNYDYMIKAFPMILREIPNAILYIIGSGPEGSYYASLIEKLELKRHVFMSGKVDQAARYIRAFDVFFLVSEFEGLPYSLLEATSADVPAIAPSVGGIPEMVAGDALYSPENKDELIKLSIKIAKDAIFRKKIAKENKKKSEAFSLRTMSDSYAEAYRSLLKAREQGVPAVGKNG